MISFEINVADADGKLGELQALLDDLTPVMNEIGRFLVISTQDRMAEGKSPDGSPFAPRSPVTLAAYERRGQRYHPQPLRMTDTMRTKTIHHAYDRDSVSVGSSAIQSKVMQFGAAQGAFGAWMGKDKLGRDHFHHLPWGTIPARPFLGVSPSDEDGILGIVAEALEVLLAP